MAEHVAMQLLNPQQAHQAIAGYLWTTVKALTTAGHRLVLTVVDAEDEKSAKQRRYYHGVILKEIALKAEINGKKFPLAVWKEHFRREYLPDKRKRVKNPVTGKSMTIRVRQSTEGLSVKKYNLLIERVTAFAVTELNVEFSEPNFERWGDVDPETGEIFQ